jgi:hypothetical protein
MEEGEEWSVAIQQGVQLDWGLCDRITLHT